MPTSTARASASAGATSSDFDEFCRDIDESAEDVLALTKDELVATMGDILGYKPMKQGKILTQWEQQRTLFRDTGVVSAVALTNDFAGEGTSSSSSRRDDPTNVVPKKKRGDNPPKTKTVPKKGGKTVRAVKDKLCSRKAATNKARPTKRRAARFCPRGNWAPVVKLAASKVEEAKKAEPGCEKNQDIIMQKVDEAYEELMKNDSTFKVRWRVGSQMKNNKRKEVSCSVQKMCVDGYWEVNKAVDKKRPESYGSRRTTRWKRFERACADDGGTTTPVENAAKCCSMRRCTAVSEGVEFGNKCSRHFCGEMKQERMANIAAAARNSADRAAFADPNPHILAAKRNNEGLAAIPLGKDANEFSSPIQPTDEWQTVYDKMIAAGWRSENGRGVNDRTYVLPEGKGNRIGQKGGRQGFDFLISLDEMKIFAIDHLGWDGDFEIWRELVAHENGGRSGGSRARTPRRKCSKATNTAIA